MKGRRKESSSSISSVCVCTPYIRKCVQGFNFNSEYSVLPREFSLESRPGFVEVGGEKHQLDLYHIRRSNNNYLSGLPPSIGFPARQVIAKFIQVIPYLSFHVSVQRR